MSGGDPTAFHAGHPAAPLALRAVSQITPNAAGSHAPGGQGGGGFSYPVVPAAHPLHALAREGIATFWPDVAAGRVRLTKWEDQFVWDCRAVGYDWPRIALAIVSRRLTRRAAIRKANTARLNAHAKRWRAGYRRERGL